MNRFHVYRCLPVLLGGFLLCGLVSETAQANQSQRDQEQSTVRQGLPGRRISGGSRGQTEACLMSPDNLVALMPESNVVTTASETPTLWFYMPQTNSSSSIEFSMFNQQDELIYTKQLPANEQAGIVGLTLNASELVLELEINQTYRWHLAVVCDTEDRSEDIWVEGNLQRIEAPATLAQQLSMASATERPSVYWAAGLWHEAMTDIAMLYQTGGTINHAAVVNRWQALLESVNLGNAGVSPQETSWRTIELSFNF
jgi:Domain of Unknown Function (DUF928)